MNFVCFFCAKFERKVSLSWRYFCISRVISLNSVSETRLLSKACETELFIESCFETARARILQFLLTLRSSFLLITDRTVEAPPDKAATAATGAPMTIPTPGSDVAKAPEDRTAVKAPRETTE